jgi:predicted RND superfamily exporter protein
MAIAVIGGIIVSTVLSLLVVPAFFLIMDDLSRLLGRIFSRFVGKKEEEDPILSDEELSRATRTSEAKLNELEQRMRAMEGRPTNPASERQGQPGGNNVLRLPPLAAE